jgi:uncharacterized protein (DUF1501 family)
VNRSRRRILQGVALGAAGLLPAPGLRGLLFAQDAAPGRMLVVLHLRGGCDGLHLLSPASDANFNEARVSDLRVAADGAEAGHAVLHVQPGAPEFRLHASAGALAELVTARRLAFVHAAGLPDATRSHFVATDMIEHGVADGASLNATPTGWLARSAASSGRDDAGKAGLRSVSTSNAPSGVWSGDARVISVTDLGNGVAASGGPQAVEVLGKLYAQTGTASPVTDAGRFALATLETIDAHLTRDARGKYVAYAAQNGVNYDAAHELGRPLLTLAQLIKMDLGLRAATVDLGGWDTHEYQAGRFRNQVERLSNGLGAFYADMSRYHDRLMVVVITEFGRRLRSNRSNGTDHGRGSVMMVLGGAVQGGRIHGRWPGLATEQLDEGMDLAVANDYRQVLSEAVGWWRATPRPDVFAGFRPAQSLGMFG